MLSKFLKFAAGTALIAVLGMSNVQARDVGLTPGLVVGIGGDIAFAISENTHYKLQDTWTAVAAAPFSTFSAKYDSSTYGGNARFGYLMENGVEGTIEVGYRQVKFKDKTVTQQTMEADDITGMLVGKYYVDLGSMIYPYIEAGIGVARSNVKGTMFAPQAVAPATVPAADTTVMFDSMKAYRLAYQAGAGLSTAMQSAIIGVGYKFFGVAKMDDSKDYSDVTGSITPALAAAGAGPAGAAANTGVLDFTTSAKYKFGKFTQNIHTVEAFINIVM